MGNNEAKFQKVFEQIDTSGDKQISGEELFKYMFSNKKVQDVMSKQMTKKEQEDLKTELMNVGKNDKNNDGKLSLEEFNGAIKANANIQKFVDKMGDEIFKNLL